jgi:hypothetical protein
MISWIIQITIISIVLIILVHHLINFFKSTLTVPKLKDLVNRPNLQYDNIYNIVNQDKNQSKLQYKNLDLNTTPQTDNEYNLIDLLPQNDLAPLQMKNELKNFLKSQLHE